MSKKNRGQIVTQSKGILLTQQYSGPLPTPAHLEHYENVLPGAAERIMSMAETQSKHRQALESRVIRSDIRNSLLGLIFAFIIGLLGVGSGGLLIYIGKIVEGSIFSGATMVALVTTFIYGSRQRQKERQSREQQ